MTEKQNLDRLIRQRYPFPISHSYTYLQSRVDPQDRHAALLACFEVTLKSITVIALANFVRDVEDDPDLGNMHLFRDLLQILSRPISLGHWQELLWKTLRPYQEKRELLVVPELFDFYYRVTESGKVKSQKPYVQIIQQMIAERNEEAHHRNRSQTSAFQRKAELPPLEQDLRTLLDGLRFLADYPWLYVESAEHHDGAWHYQANYACGSNYPFQQRTWKTSLGVNSHRCLLVNEERHVALELNPFAIITTEGRLQQPDIFFFDGVFSSGRANFMNYHISDYIDPSDEGSPATVASDAISSLLRLLQNRLPTKVEEEEAPVEEQLSAVEVYRQAANWASEHGERQTITLNALRQILELPRKEALKQEVEIEAKHGIEIEPEEVELPFEGEPTWANLAHHVLLHSGQDQMYYRDVAVEAEELKDRCDPDWQKGDSGSVAATVGHVMRDDPRFYKVRRGYYRLTQNSDLLSNPSWANLAYFVLKYKDPQGQGMHLQEITDEAMELKEKYSDWRSDGARTPSHTVSATMSMDHRFESLPDRGYWRLVQTEHPEEVGSISRAAQSTTTRHQAYNTILARLEQMGEVSRLPFGRTYYALDGKIHLMFRYSKAHDRNNAIEYFLGVTPEYVQRIKELGNGFIVFVLGTSATVLLVPVEDFETWVEGVEVSGSGTWPMSFRHTEANPQHITRWVSGADREDVSRYLNDYADLQTILADN